MKTYKGNFWSDSSVHILKRKTKQEGDKEGEEEE